ncbi:MAG TPA: hypothetical protein VIK14_16400 [Ignavibacteria bacterium]
MILLITNKEDITTDFIVKKLSEKKIPFYRLNTEDIIRNLKIDINFKENIFTIKDSIKNEYINSDQIESVYFRRPKLPDLKDESFELGEKRFFLNEMNYFFEGIYSILNDAFWISPVFSIRKAENKIFQLVLANTIGFKIPDGIISNEIVSLNKFLNKNDNRCIIKPIKTGYIEESDSLKLIYTSDIDSEIVNKYKNTILYPTYLQSKIEKKTDIRVTVVGNKTFPAAILSQEYEETKTDWRKGTKVELKHEIIKLPEDIENKCILITKKLDLKFGAIDLILNENGEYIFLEINPNGQWAWIEKRLGYRISEEIINLLINKTFE